MRSDMPTELLEKEPGNSKADHPVDGPFEKGRAGTEIQGQPLIDRYDEKAVSKSAGGGHVTQPRD